MPAQADGMETSEATEEVRPKGKGKGKGGRLTGAPELKVWVGGLAPEVKWKDLQTHVDQAGKSAWVEVFSGKNAGTGAVVFKTAEDAANCVRTLNGSILAGQTIILDAWVPRPKDEANPVAPEAPPGTVL
mmetsp:Transcript_147016/g.382099  ORF Transcript_147016/g.382099 Transcript_147016/m.382099 type:complete len:130 (-) Transcript_147016:162-551(-)